METRQKAQALIMAGAVQVDGRRVEKAGTFVDTAVAISLLEPECPFVSRGGIKLDHALSVFGIPVAGAECLDLGSSTGGFTDCLLQRGARKVYCVDVGRNQLHWKLRNDPRVVLREGYNARDLDPADFPEALFQVAVMDLAFISQRLVLPRVQYLLGCRGDREVNLVTLVKPQFEAGRADVGKGGIVRNEEVRMRVLRDVVQDASALGFAVTAWERSPITGADGNVEFLLHLRFSGQSPISGVRHDAGSI